MARPANDGFLLSTTCSYWSPTKSNFDPGAGISVESSFSVVLSLLLCCSSKKLFHVFFLFQFNHIIVRGPTAPVESRYYWWSSLYAQHYRT